MTRQRTVVLLIFGSFLRHRFSWQVTLECQLFEPDLAPRSALTATPGGRLRPPQAHDSFAGSDPPYGVPHELPLSVCRGSPSRVEVPG